MSKNRKAQPATPEAELSVPSEEAPTAVGHQAADATAAGDEPATPPTRAAAAGRAGASGAAGDGGKRFEIHARSRQSLEPCHEDVIPTLRDGPGGRGVIAYCDDPRLAHAIGQLDGVRVVDLHKQAAAD